MTVVRREEPSAGFSFSAKSTHGDGYLQLDNPSLVLASSYY